MLVLESLLKFDWAFQTNCLEGQPQTEVSLVEHEFRNSGIEALETRYMFISS